MLSALHNFSQFTLNFWESQHNVNFLIVSNNLCLFQGILALKIVDELTMWFFTLGETTLPLHFVISRTNTKIFVLEYLIRFLCAPRRWLFFKAPLNLVDLLAILPYFVSFVMEELKVRICI